MNPDPEQERYDLEDAALLLDALTEAVEEERAAVERVRLAQNELTRAKAAHRTAKRRLDEQAFLARQRRRAQRGESNV